MYIQLTAKPKSINTLNLEVNVKVKKSLFSKNHEKQGFLADLNRYWKVLRKGKKEN